jgi:hypothetical protein
MNHIHALTTRATNAEAALAPKEIVIDEFRAYLASPKFQGLDLDGARKDWIAVADVFAWLGRIREVGG